MARRTLRGRWVHLGTPGTIGTTTTYPGFYGSPAGTDHSRVFVPAMRDGWQFPSGWGDTVASRETGRVYFTAPMPLHNTSAYNEALLLVRAKCRDCIVISARDAFTSRRGWLDDRERVLTGVTRLYVLVPLDGRVGPGVGWELAFARSHNPSVSARALKALQLDGGFTLSTGPQGDGYLIAGTWPDFADYRSWDAAPALARVVFRRLALSLVPLAGADSADRTRQRQDSVSGDDPNEGESAA
jgi:hypothetical protein